MSTSKELTVAVVGNPNSGKTTLFNALTGSNQKVGNWAGVTVEKIEGAINLGNKKARLVDLPGIYALSATSEDERIALNYLLSGEPDFILNIVDATNLERNLYLTVQLAEMGIPMAIVVNMMDIAEGRHLEIYLDELSSKFGCPTIGVSATKKSDVERVRQWILEAVDAKEAPQIHVNYPTSIREWLSGNITNYTKTAKLIGVPEVWVGLQILEGIMPVKKRAIDNGEFDEKEFEFIKSLPGGGDNTELQIIESRYTYIHGILTSVVKKARNTENFSSKLDKVVLNRFLGIPIFLFAMYMVFWATLSIGGSFIDFFEIAFEAIFVDALGELLANIGAPLWLITIVATGIGAGLTTVSSFVPIVFVMFLCLAILEDSGYMARAAFVMDRLMRTIGLPGKSFVPMLVGFGCTVPAVMATRTLETTRDRILTIFMTPFMSCGAKLPVYALFGVAFFGDRAGLVVFSLYVLGGVAAIFTGLLLKNTMFKGDSSFFIMELPPYHMPKITSVLRSAFGRLKAFIINAGKVIIVAVALLGIFNSLGTDGSFGNQDAENSVLSYVGIKLTPIFEPLGVEKENWPATVSLFTGLFAKEAVIGTLNSLYAQIDAVEVEDDEEFSLKASLAEAFLSIPENLGGLISDLADPFGLSLIHEDEEVIAAEADAGVGVISSMQKYFTQGPLQAYAYLIFILLYIPCMAAIGATVREIGPKLSSVLCVYLMLLGWVTATLFYQVTLGRQLLWIVIPLVLLVLMGVSLRIIGKSNYMMDRMID